MCERSLTLRALVTERLTAAAEEIFALVERTIAEYEEELCRSKEENQRKQQLLDSVLSPKVRVFRTEDVKSKCRSSNSTPFSHCVSEKPEENPTQRFDLSVVQVKSEDPAEQTSELHQSRSTRRENDTNPETTYEDPERGQDSSGFNFDHFQQNGYSTDNSEDWGETSSSAKLMKTEDDGDVGVGYEQIMINSNFTTDRVREHRCTVCGKVFTGHSLLKRHSVVHTGEKPFSCSYCDKSFSQKAHLKVHMCSHTGIMPYRCSLCSRGFTRRDYFLKHLGTHKRPTGPLSDRRNGPLSDRRNGPLSDRRVGPLSDRRNGPLSDRRVGPLSDRRNGPLSDQRAGPQIQKLQEKTAEREDPSGSHGQVQSLFVCCFCQKSFLCKNDIENHIKIHTGNDTASRDVSTR